MAINIGEKIKARAKELRIGPTELGKMINTSKQNIYGIYKRKSLDTYTLSKLSTALKFDFFALFGQSDDETPALITSESLVKYEKSSQKSVPLKEYQKLKAEYDNLKEKYDLLQKINTLLEKKRK